MFPPAMGLRKESLFFLRQTAHIRVGEELSAFPRNHPACTLVGWGLSYYCSALGRLIMRNDHRPGIMIMHARNSGPTDHARTAGALQQQPFIPGQKNGHPPTTIPPGLIFHLIMHWAYSIMSRAHSAIM